MEISKDYLVSIIDHTLLKPNATKKDLDLLLSEAALHKFGAVCIRPCDVSYASHEMKDTGVKICTVVGFPWGIQSIESKVYEAQHAILEGADEIDMVINRYYAKGEKLEDYGLLRKEIGDVVRGCRNPIYAKRNILVKVILETCELTEYEIVMACLAAKDGCADYVKTSTGLYKGALVKDVKLMKKIVPKLGVKASGGIKDWKKAEKLIKAGATRLGTSSGIEILKGYMQELQSKSCSCSSCGPECGGKQE